MKNFSDVISLFQDLPSVNDVLLIDADGLTLAGSLSNKHQMEKSSPILHALLNDIFKHLAMLGGETTNQICFVQDSQIIIAQPVYDVILIVYTEKRELDLLQPRFSKAVSVLQRIVAPDFSNT
jgi:predicted regulator of Ras-like GTPase activity (Roadblock/LC7/MglB family)